METRTIIFVHGTSVRREGFQPDYLRINERLAGDWGPFQVETRPCPWGDRFGAKLHRNGASIPNYRKTRKEPDAPSESDYNEALWFHLERDPLFEFHVLRLDRPGEGDTSPGEAIWRKLNALDFSMLTVKPDLLRIRDLLGDHLNQVRDWLVQQEVVEPVVIATGSRYEPPTECCVALARVLISRAINVSGFEISEADRDSLLIAIVNAFDGYKAGQNLWGLLTQNVIVSPTVLVLTELALLKRGCQTDLVSGFLADIIMYQGRGADIRDYIADAVKTAPDGPKILLGHSLGGIMCVDALNLLSELRKEVKLLITVGSQAPLFYEWNGLASRRVNEPFAEDFPTWINVYDRRDVLSYIGEEGVFPDERKPKDIPVDNKVGFPDSHTTYFRNPHNGGTDRNKEIWQHIRKAVNAL